MQKFNILLVIIDCLRFDRVTKQYMPFLTEFGNQNTIFTNCWSVSHCTDPSITALLSGKWPDELRLYSMMFEHKDYTIPDDVKMLAQTAQEYGYSTGMLSNLGRWYTRGVYEYINSRQWRAETFTEAIKMMDRLKEPWFITVHDDSCHTNYRGGNYDAACRAVDYDLNRMLWHVTETDRQDNTFVFITSDHGEGLGDHGIKQHGYGLWPMLTHVPLIVYGPHVHKEREQSSVTQHIDIYSWIRQYLGAEWREDMVRADVGYAHLVGRTPRWWHRGVTDGKLMVIKEQSAETSECKWFIVNCKNGTYETLSFGDVMVLAEHLWNAARAHALRFGINADVDKLDDGVLEDRLRSLGYFS